MTKMISVEDGQPIWIDVCFCHSCKRSCYDDSRNKDMPYFCPLWNEWMRANDYCSRGKED